MAESRLPRRSLALLAALLAMFVALGAVLVAEPFDAWTPVFSGGDADAPAVGDHALPTEDKHQRTAQSRRVLPNPLGRLRRMRARREHARRRAERRHPVILGVPFELRRRPRSCPAPDRAPPRPIAA
jgi:hypothetical protein